MTECIFQQHLLVQMKVTAMLQNIKFPNEVQTLYIHHVQYIGFFVALVFFSFDCNGQNETFII